MNVLQPPNWPRPSGYSNGLAAAGKLIFVAGQVGSNETGAIKSGDFVAQVGQALKNVVAVLAEAGAGPEHVVRLTWFIIDKQTYLNSLKEIGAAYRNVMGKHFPTMSVVEVSALIEDRASVEIEATAVLPS